MSSGSQRLLQENEFPEFQYKPEQRFIRCHSHMDDPGDFHTKVWRCAYEPVPGRPSDWTGLVATCGGSMVCIINVAKLTVISKLLQTEDQFFDVLWTTVKFSDKIKTNVLISAGSEGRLTLIHPSKNKVFAHLSICPKIYISSIKAHPSRAHWVFCAIDHGKIILVDTGLEGSTNYKLSWTKLREFSCAGTDCIHLCIPNDHLLIVACQHGCYAWRLPEARELAEVKTEPLAQHARLQFPVSNNNDNYCDGLTMIDKGTVAIKFSRSANIIIWSLDGVKQLIKEDAGTIKIQPDLVLPWASTREIYIDITARNGLLVAGDPRGAVILYSLSQYLKDKKAYKSTPTPKCTLVWPSLKPDQSHELNQRLKGFTSAPLINHASISPDNKYLLVCTENNLVCIWKNDKY